jgi:tRNA1(Val) A37 N6-methylase TrmN6
MRASAPGSLAMTCPERNEPGRQVSEDAFLGGALMVLQLVGGHRAGIDAVLLAAAVPVKAAAWERVLDVGAGVGVVGLCIAARVGQAHVTLLEIEPDLAEIARGNVARNGLEGRLEVISADIGAAARTHAELGLRPGTFSHVVANPPFHVQGRGRPARDPIKAGAHAMPEGGLERWVQLMARLAASGGSATLIHRAEALGELLALLEGRFGGLRVLPIHPRAGAPAVRVLVQGRKGSRAPLTLLPGLFLHGDDNCFLPDVEAILRRRAGLDLGFGI